ncbi:predicted protein [Coccidioides posadasii str. Silveira]|uniref:Predicted protein n=1 Tax=Coccidioides posadasii (strain RMSCC 757 / Silveira) TaxID=443226 RepID=E9DIU9_COCPS|nr:predicted protein [Coccidioides posadasii str. Silveira]
MYSNTLHNPMQEIIYTLIVAHTSCDDPPSHPPMDPFSPYSQEAWMYPVPVWYIQTGLLIFRMPTVGSFLPRLKLNCSELVIEEANHNTAVRNTNTASLQNKKLQIGVGITKQAVFGITSGKHAGMINM